jgi:hypothetical protein
MRVLTITLAKAAPGGVYVSVKPLLSAANTICCLIDRVKLQINCTVRDPDSLHVTEIYSRTDNDAFSADPTLMHTAYITGVENWAETSEGDILVALLSCPSLDKRQSALRKKYGFTFDYEEYKPHLTLCVVNSWSSQGEKEYFLEILNKIFLDRKLTLTSETSEPLDES